ncbi:hypothetical protein DSO57_1010930 [Entomophthora muscae]|uniref:Uncharacterized protein n=1 Tax=Entomophthora muscae TaxID=34485 RepID=A0ACC2SV73_9FUNG|nr:hypothetical protein DSO57_1010930 [Entomophthora muscae]
MNLINLNCVLVASAGNRNQDACNSLPADDPYVITVGVSDVYDEHASFYNWGKCVKVFAPGNKIKSLSIKGDTKIDSGTSMAAPHVAGLASIVLSKKKAYKPADVLK